MSLHKNSDANWQDEGATEQDWLALQFKSGDFWGRKATMLSWVKIDTISWNEELVNTPRTTSQISLPKVSEAPLSIKETK